MNLPRNFPASPGQWAVLHAATLGIILAWSVGGMSPFARVLAEFCVLPAPLLALWAWRRASHQTRRVALGIAIPLALLSLQVGASFLNPSAALVHFGDTPMLRPRAHLTWLPSSFYPAASWRDFALNAGFILIGLNLLLAQPRRSWLRGLMAALAINGAVLACVGSFFKLIGATAILNFIPSSNSHFFASFVYHNHWGAYALLTAGCAAGLAFYYESQRGDRPVTATPCPTFALATLLIVLALPLSSGRAATAIGAFLVVVCLALAFRRAWRRIGRGSLGIVLLLALAFGSAGGWLVLRELQQAIAKTRGQIDAWNNHGTRDGRFIIYQDTIHLIAEQPLFGWGWHSFPYVYPLVRSPLPKLEASQKTPTAVLDAHNDWLQFLAENGAVGLGLALAALVGILRAAPFAAWRLAPSREILLAIVALLLLASIDFPLACPAVALTASIVLFAAAALARGIAPTNRPASAT